MRTATAMLAVAATLMLASPALAHPLVDRGNHAYDEADFEGALSAFAAADAASDLTRADVIALLRGRALVQFALGAQREMHIALASLLALDPTWTPDAQVPPGVRTELEALRATHPAPLAVTLTATANVAGATVQATVEGDPGGLVREVRLSARTHGHEMVRAAGRSVLVPGAHSGETLDVVVSVIGPGGAVLTSLGDEPTPAAVIVEGGNAVTEGVPRGGGGGDSLPLVLGLVGGGVAIAAAVVIILFVVLSGQGNVHVGPPMLAM